MSLSEEVTRINTIFIDTAPIIYYIKDCSRFCWYTYGGRIVVDENMVYLKI